MYLKPIPYTFESEEKVREIFRDFEEFYQRLEEFWDKMTGRSKVERMLHVLEMHERVKRIREDERISRESGLNLLSYKICGSGIRRL